MAMSGGQGEGDKREQERETLLSLLDIIIPPSEDGRLPGADAVGFIEYMYKENLDAWIMAGVQSIHEEALGRYGAAFHNLEESLKMRIIEALRTRLFRFFSQLTMAVIKCYYQDDRVLLAIGAEPRAPFPLGFSLPDGDLTLLDEVYERGKIYRDV